MRGDASGPTLTPIRSDAARNQFFKATLSTIPGRGLAHSAPYASAVGPWLWWSDYGERTQSSPLVQMRKPPPAGVLQPWPTGSDSSVSLVPQRLVSAATRRGRNASFRPVSIGVIARSPWIHRARALLANGARIAARPSDPGDLLHRAVA
jgi:hypothetical protein